MYPSLWPCPIIRLWICWTLTPKKTKKISNPLQGKFKKPAYNCQDKTYLHLYYLPKPSREKAALGHSSHGSHLKTSKAWQEISRHKLRQLNTTLDSGRLAPALPTTTTTKMLNQPGAANPEFPSNCKNCKIRKAVCCANRKANFTVNQNAGIALAFIHTS